jgi:hypothetical protein
MPINLDDKVQSELKSFSDKLASGFDPITAFQAMLPRILKEQDRDTRHNCAEAVLKTQDSTEAHGVCMNVQSFELTKKLKLK